MSSLNIFFKKKNLAGGETYTCAENDAVYRYRRKFSILAIVLTQELTPLRAETTISWSKSLDNLSKNDEVCSNEWCWSDDSTSYSSPKFVLAPKEASEYSAKTHWI